LVYGDCVYGFQKASAMCCGVNTNNAREGNEYYNGSNFVDGLMG